jgi:hypothetical protein
VREEWLLVQGDSGEYRVREEWLLVQGRMIQENIMLVQGDSGGCPVINVRREKLLD